MEPAGRADQGFRRAARERGERRDSLDLDDVRAGNRGGAAAQELIIATGTDVKAQGGATEREIDASAIELESAAGVIAGHVEARAGREAQRGIGGTGGVDAAVGRLGANTAPL